MSSIMTLDIRPFWPDDMYATLDSPEGNGLLAEPDVAALMPDAYPFGTLSLTYQRMILKDACNNLFLLHTFVAFFHSFFLYQSLIHSMY